MSYISGVPVKISENYKPPKKIALNTSITQRLANQSAAAEAEVYDFSLERTVVSKMTAWQQYRGQAAVDRKERMRLRQLDRLKQLEEKQKRMLTEVSYPSADDLTSDDEESAGDARPSPRAAELTVSVPQRQLSPTSYFDSILVPTVMARQRKAAAITPTNSKINYSDFENDTSSPFDNIELKTINDLDILAEVLNTTAGAKREQPSRAAPQPKQSDPSPEAKPQAPEQATTNGDCRTTDRNQMPSNAASYYADASAQYGAMTHAAQSYAAGRYSYHPPSTVVGVAQVYAHPHALPPSVISAMQSAEAAKAHSVPDIVSEMNAELKNLERRRVRKSSESGGRPKGSAATSPARKPQPTEQNALFRSLSGSSQTLVTNISSMGFPVERVARITEKLGREDDKKVRFDEVVGAAQP